MPAQFVLFDGFDPLDVLAPSEAGAAGDVRAEEGLTEEERQGTVASGLDLGLHLMEREFGPHVARDVGRLFAQERRGVVRRERRPSAPAAR
ncbi:hypothetical protein ABZ860_17465 [Microbispora sp. NPDC046973]|uniref:hypothetical protein n=1 Tax=Microbispora sp. NPDC046973 TaxID=3155022 RepID=UPI0033D2F6B0